MLVWKSDETLQLVISNIDFQTVLDLSSI